MGRALPAYRRRTWRTRTFLQASPVRCRFAAGPPGSLADAASRPPRAGPSLAQPAASGPCAPRSRSAPRRAMLAALGRLNRSCGVAEGNTLPRVPLPPSVPSSPTTRATWISLQSSVSASPQHATAVGAAGRGAAAMRGGAPVGAAGGSEIDAEPPGDGLPGQAARLKCAPGVAAATTRSPIASATAPQGRAPPWSAARSSRAPMTASWRVESTHSPRNAPSLLSSFVCSAHTEASAGTASGPAPEKMASIAAGRSKWSMSTFRASAARCRSGMATCRRPAGCEVLLAAGVAEALARLLAAAPAPAAAEPPAPGGCIAGLVVAALEKARGSKSPS
mmetsp:Transcript_4795/g.15063  ORF Transcript_4795/g.15063 Transcript_4795/m.15063 type:complete len:335 (+) Transcript_4795:429-1433(+)